MVPYWIGICWLETCVCLLPPGCLWFGLACVSYVGAGLLGSSRAVGCMEWCTYPRFQVEVWTWRKRELGSKYAGRLKFVSHLCPGLRQVSQEVSRLCWNRPFGVGSGVVCWFTIVGEAVEATVPSYSYSNLWFQAHPSPLMSPPSFATVSSI